LLFFVFILTWGNQSNFYCVDQIQEKSKLIRPSPLLFIIHSKFIYIE